MQYLVYLEYVLKVLPFNIYTEDFTPFHKQAPQDKYLGSIQPIEVPFGAKQSIINYLLFVFKPVIKESSFLRGKMSIEWYND